ncbi:chemotaxis protein CheA [Yoonia sp.]|uniref:chemotaxis protein CheA n=1 Tax=Yoonia sp. TaxID=2212373 RepID=UPI00358DDFFC
MMDSAILDAFFEECEDLLVALSDGLADMREGLADDETLNAVFRSVHSIKGAAGAFSLEDVVGFAHIFETVLDDVRSKKLATDEALLRVLQRAGDILANLIDAARDNLPADRDQVDPVLRELESFLSTDDLVEEEFVFEALTLSFDTPDSGTDFEVSFHPSAEFYAAGNDPALFISALHDLGPCTVQAETVKLPTDLADFDWTKGYLTWHVVVADQQNDLAIREIFEFADDLCALKVHETAKDDPQPDAVSLPEEVETVPEPDLDPAQAAPPSTQKPSKKPASTLRVDPERVDRLINAVGELIINQSVISQRIEEASLPNSSELYGDLDNYKLLAREIQEGVMAIRAQPVKPLFQRMLRIAREAADATGKDVNLVTDGEATEVDKIVVERLADPLTHMIRNAIDHGIEKPEERAKTDKPSTGTLRLTASQRSGSIVIEIIDDGKGLNRERIKEIAVSKGLISADAQLSAQEIDHLLFAPGFSTATEVTNLSGRGVGMDVVKTAITALGGRIAINSIAGQGTTFSITLPLTLAVMDGMIIHVGGQTMVVPITSILETIRPASTDLAQIGLDNQLLRIRGDYVPIIDLAERFGVAPQSPSLTDRVLLLIQTESVSQCAIAVDDILDQRQVVVKSMQGTYGEITGISGATILGDGKIALIIDPDAIAAGQGNALSTQIRAQKEDAYATT